MSVLDMVFFRTYRKPGNLEAIEVMALKDGFILRTYYEWCKGAEIIATPEELITFRDLLTQKIEEFQNR